MNTNFWRRICRRMRFSAVLTLAAFERFSLPAHAATAVLNPVADTELRSAAPALVVTGDTIVAGGLGDNSPNETRRALLKFDLGAIPTNAVIEDAQLTLQVVRVPLNSANSTFELRRLSRDWNESEATWNFRLNGIAWEAPGALGGLDAASTASATAPVTGLGAVVFGSAPGLIADIQGWVLDPASNHGWLLRSQAEDVLRTARHFASREASTPEIRPQLTITFTVPLVIDGVSLDAGELVFQFLGRAGENCQLQSRSVLNSGIWEVVRSLDPVTEDQVVVVREPVASQAGARFFRLVVE